LMEHQTERLLRSCRTGNLPVLVETWEYALKLVDLLGDTSTSEKDLCSVRDKSNGRTLLHTALFGFQLRTPTDPPKGWLDVVKFLLDHGVSANELHRSPDDPVTNIHYSALMTACFCVSCFPDHDHPATEQMVSLLLLYGADPLHKASDDVTAMSVAASECNLNAIRVLVSVGNVPFDEEAESILRGSLSHRYLKFVEEVRALQ